MGKRELWEFKYKPVGFGQMILNEDIKPALNEALTTRPNMLIYGPPGIGKGTYVDCLIEHHNLKGHTLKINASEETGIDMIRDKVKVFASAMTMDNKLKLVYLNEADSLTSGPQGAQKMLRDLMEQTQKLTQFIFCCNYEQYIIPELKSRCQLYNIATPPAADIFKYCRLILKQEKIKYNPETLISLVKKTYPDIRNTIITLRQNVNNGKLSDIIVKSASEVVFSSILTQMKTDPSEVRKILKSNSIHYDGLYSYIYEQLMNDDGDIFSDDANAIIHIGEGSYRNSVVANKEIAFMSMYFKMLSDSTIKL